MEYLLTLFYTCVFLYLINKIPFYRAEGLPKIAVSLIFILKVLAGILMSLLYTYYYTDRTTADIFKYFDDSKIMYNALFDKPVDFLQMLTGIGNDSPYFNEHYYKIMNNWYRVYESNIYNESHTIIRINAVLRVFSSGYYNVHTVFFCFLSLTGLVGIYKTAINFIKNKNAELIVGIFLLPSVVFWGSGVIKETVLFFGLGLLVYNFFRILKKFNWLYLLWIIISCIIIYYTKFYVFIIILPVLLANLWVGKTKDKYVFLKYITVFVIYIFAGLNIHYIFPSIDALDILVTKQRDFIGLAKFMNSGSLIDIPVLYNDIWSFIMYAPLAFFNTLFRPFIFESHSVMIFMASIENMFLLAIIVIALFFFNKQKVNINFLFTCLFIVISIFILTGLITPVLGAMVRYKTPALPFLMILLIMLIDKDKLLKKIPFLKFLKK